MRILILSPIPAGSQRGNNVTALRWQDLLQSQGHTVELEYGSQLPNNLNVDCVLLLHALRSYEAVVMLAAQEFPLEKIAVCITGTDLHRDFDPSGNLSADPQVRQNYDRLIRVWDLTGKIILLEPEAAKRIPTRFHNKCEVIYQSAVRAAHPLELPVSVFRFAVIGHLRWEKDPFRAAEASHLLPADSRIEIVQLGEALSPAMRSRAESESRSNMRYQWLGVKDHQHTLNQLAGCHVLILTSRMEGAPSVISEAIINDIPIICSRIDATVGLLGSDYPGFFQVEDTQELANLMLRCEREPSFMKQLLKAGNKRRVQFQPESELVSLKTLIKNM